MPLAIKAKVNITMVIKYTKINAITDIAMCSPMVVWFTLTVRTAFGCNNSKASRILNLANASARAILMPPPIEPVLARMLLRKNIHKETSSGQLPKSVLAKPPARPTEIKLKPT